MLSGVIGTEGRVMQISVVRPLSHGLTDKAIKCLQKWRFEPAVRDGVPVAVKGSFDINFRLPRV